MNLQTTNHFLAYPNYKPVADLESTFQGLSVSQNSPEDHYPSYQLPTSNYGYAFDNIITFINDNFRRLSENELKVTRAFAGPFTPGGLLVLMQEPLASHPWAKGLDTVISTCQSLDALREAILNASSGEQCITKNVSVIDRWPFLHKSLHEKLKETREDEMRAYDRLVLAAIRAKQPEAILCMGKVSS
jgi:uncharacterized protein YllA (UPF0747 family)